MKDANIVVSFQEVELLRPTQVYRIRIYLRVIHIKLIVKSEREGEPSKCENAEAKKKICCSVCVRGREL